MTEDGQLTQVLSMAYIIHIQIHMHIHVHIPILYMYIYIYIYIHVHVYQICMCRRYGQTMLFLPSVAHAFWSLLDIWHTFQSPFWLQARPERVPQRTKRVATAQWPENGCSVPV